MLLHAIALITISSVSVDTEEEKVRYSIECSMEEFAGKVLENTCSSSFSTLSIMYVVLLR